MELLAMNYELFLFSVLFIGVKEMPISVVGSVLGDSI